MLPDLDDSELGATYHVGRPGSGKTTGALAEAVALSKKSGWPIVVIDPVFASNFAAFPRVDSVEAMIVQTWEKGGHVAFHPYDEEEAEAAFRAVYGGKRVHLIVDEAHYYLSAWYLSPSLERLLRSYRHARVSIHLTTQSYSDVPQRAFAQSPRVKVYRSTARRTLDRLEDEHELDPEQVRTLARGEFIDVSDEEFSSGHRAEKPNGESREETPQRSREDRHDRRTPLGSGS